MKEIIYLLIDITEAVLKGSMLVWLLQGMAKERVRWSTRIGQSRISYAQTMMFIQFVTVQMLFYSTPAVKRRMYGERMLPVDSIMTVPVIAAAILITYVLSMVVYDEHKGKLFVYISAFYTMIELIRFMIYSIYVVLLNFILQFCLYLFELGYWNEEGAFERGVSGIEIVWNILFIVTLLSLLWICVKQYKKALWGKSEKLNSVDILFLLIPNMIGMLLCVLVRTIFYKVNGNQVFIIFDEHAELRLLVPCIALLSIVSILLTAKVFRKMAEVNEEKLQLQVYKEHMRGIEAHVRDVEQMYDNIRSMKHDMRHHIADLDILLRNEKPADEMRLQLEAYREELEHSIEQYEMKYKTGHPVTDVIINKYVNIALEKNISFESDFIYPKNLCMSALDLSVILNNALENAIEACEKMPEGEKRYITLHSFCRENMFFVEVVNCFFGKLAYETDTADARIVTTKSEKEMHGFGLKNIESCAAKYYGRVECSVQDGTFKLCVMLQK